MYLTLLVLLLTVYAGVKFIPPYWAYLGMQDSVKAAAHAAAKPGGEERARQQLIAVAKEYGIELDGERIDIAVDNQLLTLRASWETPVEFPKYRKILHFTIESTVPAP